MERPFNEGLFSWRDGIGLAAETVRRRGRPLPNLQLSSPSGSVKWPSSRRLSPTTFVTFTNHLCPHYRLPGLRARPSVIAGSALCHCGLDLPSLRARPSVIAGSTFRHCGLGPLSLRARPAISSVQTGHTNVQKRPKRTFWHKKMRLNVQNKVFLHILRRDSESSSE